MILPVFCFALSAFAGARGGVAGSGPVQPQARMGEPLPGLTPSELERFHIGQIRYNTPLSVAQGLGPVFNKSSCGNCHNDPLGGPGSQTVTRFGLVDKNGFNPLEHLGGSLLQVSAISIDCEELVPDEANVVSFRVTNGALAYGLVEAIPDASILAVRDSQPPLVQGIAHMVIAFEDPQPKPPAPPILRVGRFGHKAQVPTVLTFSADAALNEMGLTNRFVTQENAPNGDLVRLAMCDTVADPEDQTDTQGFDFIDRVTDFQRFLAPFPQTPKSGMIGEVIFNTIGCAVCHTPSFTTSNSANLEDAIRNKTIRPYSDFLLHQMGQHGDPIWQGAGVDGWVKTPTLWGVSNRNPMWHDGRVFVNDFAEAIVEVIGLHGGQGSQGQAAALAFTALPQIQKDQLMVFLGSLGQAEFDHDDDNDVDLDDFVGFHPCHTGPGSFYTPDSPCSIHDIDQDGDVDLDDFHSFMIVYHGPRRDCNSNGVLDLRDILLGVLPDSNNNGFPDSCEPTCMADVTGNGTVNIDDLFAVINTWGACPAVTLPCAGDIDFNGLVNIDDLFGVINAWGVCP